MAVDDSSLLPSVPPPRPASREAAIAAALRRFDGESKPATASADAGRWAWGRHPQWGLAVSASFVAVIGIPAALIAILDQPAAPPQPSYERATNAPEPRRTAAQPESQLDSAAEQARAPVSAIPPQPNLFPVLPDEAARPGIAAETADAAAAPAVAVGAIPPPAPEPVQQLSMQGEAEDSSVVVTGSRIRPPAFEGSRAERKSVSRSASERAIAPDSVLRDPDYRDFLSRLQSAIAQDQRSAVTRLIAYPLRVDGAGQARYYRSPTAVLGEFDEIFTPGVKAAILAQRFENLLSSDQGVMIGNGAVWVDHTCRGRNCARDGPVRITAINP